jgi:hypothetical protein
MGGHCRNVEAGNIPFRLPHSAKLRVFAGRKKVSPGDSGGKLAENWRKMDEAPPMPH